MSKIIFDVMGDLHSIRRAANITLDFIRSKCCNVNNDTLFDIKLILNEVLSNSMRHGCNKEIKYIANVVVGISDNQVYLIIQDCGQGYNYSVVLNKCSEIDLCIDNLKESGRGMLIVKSLSDRVTLNRKGNKIVILKKISNGLFEKPLKKC